MAAEFELHDAKDYVSKQAGRISPADRLVAALEGEYYTIKHASEIIGINKETLRRTLKSDKISGPSKVLTRGRMEIWLLSEEDLIEAADHYDRKDTAVSHLAVKYKGKKMPAKLAQLI